MTRVGLTLALVLAACEHRPAPKQEPAPPPPPPTTSAAVEPPDAAPADPAQRAACAKSSQHVIDIYIAAAPGESRAQLMSQRDRQIAAMTDACLVGKWTAAALACLDAGTTAESLVKCDALIRTAGVPRDGAPAPAPVVE
jgi:hypothetical protein